MEGATRAKGGGELASSEKETNRRGRSEPSFIHDEETLSPPPPRAGHRRRAIDALAPEHFQTPRAGLRRIALSSGGVSPRLALVRVTSRSRVSALRPALDAPPPRAARVARGVAPRSRTRPAIGGGGDFFFLAASRGTCRRSRRWRTRTAPRGRSCPSSGPCAPTRGCSATRARSGAGFRRKSPSVSATTTSGARGSWRSPARARPPSPRPAISNVPI